MRFFLRRFFLGGTFGASWYLMALFFGVWIAMIRNKFILSSIAVFAYVICCYTSSYMPLFAADLSPFLDIITPQQSFIVAIFWCWIGKLIATDDLRLSGCSTRMLCVFLVFGSIVFWLEWATVWHFTGLHMNDCYISLFIPVILIFELLRRWRITLECALILRQLSVVIFLSHVTVMSLIAKVLPRHWLLNVPLFLFTLMVSTVIYVTLKFLRDKLKVKVLSWAY